MNIFSEIMRGRGIGKFIAGSLGAWIVLVMAGCGAKAEVEDVAETEDDKAESVDDIVRGYFDEEKLHYDRECPEDSVIVYTLDYKDAIAMRVVISMKSESYIIEGGSYEIVIPEENALEALLALNYYNIHSTISSGAMYDDERLVFRAGRNFEGGAYSKEAFVMAYEMVLKDAVEKIPVIYEIAWQGIKPAQEGR